MNPPTNHTSPFLLLMPSYNQSHYIADAIRSVLAQDDPDWELWILDNSTDNTPQVVQQFAEHRIHFHHLPQRMDPGTCLNWMLERARGRDFSYVHTDNNLQPDYVRRMRAALAQHPLALAYCDMHAIDENGGRLHDFHRGAFDLPRLLSVSPLGVPFAATTQLAQLLGGFSIRDVADDVIFCTSAYGLAHYVHVPELLLEYRLHSQSRTEAAGGGTQMLFNFINLMPRLVPQLQQRGFDPLAQMAQAIEAAFAEWDEFVRTLWLQNFSALTAAWWPDPPHMDSLFRSGQVHIESLGVARPPRSRLVRDKHGALCMAPWRTKKLRSLIRKNQGRLNSSAEKACNILLTWACITLGVTSYDEVSIRICSLDLRTLWAANQLRQILGWRVLVDPQVSVPAWLDWSRGSGDETLLDCSTQVRLLHKQHTATPTA